MLGQESVQSWGRFRGLWQHGECPVGGNTFSPGKLVDGEIQPLPKFVSLTEQLQCFIQYFFLGVVVAGRENGVEQLTLVAGNRRGHHGGLYSARGEW